MRGDATSGLLDTCRMEDEAGPIRLSDWARDGQWKSGIGFGFRDRMFCGPRNLLFPWWARYRALRPSICKDDATWLRYCALRPNIC